MAMHTITAMFDSRAEAERAVEALVSQLGLIRSAIRVDANAPSSGSTADTTYESKGFLASLADLFMPDEDRYAYAEGIRRGGVLLSAQAEDTQADRVSDVLEQYGAVDLNARETEWRQAGWTGYSGAAAPGATTGATLGGASDGSRPAAVASSATAAGSREEAIPLAEERLRVGKRVANAGRVRVRSYVVETPVEEQVNLREEHVRVERRAADRPISASDTDLFKDRVIEAEERVEEAVVQKDVRVTGEVAVSKEATERTETVRDTVRRTEVDVDETDAANTNTTDPRRTGKAG